MKKAAVCLIVLFGLSYGMGSQGADFNGDGTDDIGIFRPTTGIWAIRGITRAYFGGKYDIPVPGDYDGNQIADIAIFRPSGGLWAIKDITRSYFGGYGDVPLSGTGGGMNSFVAGDIPIASHQGGRSCSHSYEEVAAIILGQGGTVRVFLNIYVSCWNTSACGTAYARIYRNGEPVGIEHSTTVTDDDGMYFIEDIKGWSPGDWCQVYLKHPTGTNPYAGSEPDGSSPGDYDGNGTPESTPAPSRFANLNRFEVRVGPGPWAGVAHDNAW